MSFTILMHKRKYLYSVYTTFPIQIYRIAGFRKRSLPLKTSFPNSENVLLLLKRHSLLKDRHIMESVFL